MKPEFQHASAMFKRLNPHLFHGDGLRPAVTKPVVRRPKENAGVEAQPRCLAFIITLIRLAPVPLDSHDNFAFSYKPLADAITSDLGFASDSDPAITWEYVQGRSKLRRTIVIINAMIL